MANLYYLEGISDGISAREFVPGAVVEVTGEDGRHAVRVARLRVGERISIGDGCGLLGDGEVIRTDRDRFSVRLEGVRYQPESELRFVLVQALAKGDRDERAVEQATEFGVDVIVPWQAARSVSRWDGAGGEKASKGVAKWARIAREAAKQSMRARVPEVRDPVSTADLCEAAARIDTEMLVLHPRGDASLSDWAKHWKKHWMKHRASGYSDAATASAEIHLVIGPEGGFSDGELDELSAAGATVLVLGKTVLRTSSAGPAALAVLNATLGRW